MYAQSARRNAEKLQEAHSKTRAGKMGVQNAVQKKNQKSI